MLAGLSRCSKCPYLRTLQQLRLWPRIFSAAGVALTLHYSVEVTSQPEAGGEYGSQEGGGEAERKGLGVKELTAAISSPPPAFPNPF